MVGPAPSVAHIPLRDLLPRGYVSAEGELRRLANELESHPSAGRRIAWHWYPDRTEPPHTLDTRVHLLLVDVAITLYHAGQDWLQLTLDIAWTAAAKLAVNAAVEVGCWCPKDHNMHQVREAQWYVASAALRASETATPGARFSAYPCAGFVLMDTERWFWIRTVGAPRDGDPRDGELHQATRECATFAATQSRSNSLPSMSCITRHDSS